MAAQQRHRRVPVAVDEPRCECEAVRVEEFVARLRLHVGTERGDQAVDAAQGDRLIFEHGVDNREAHDWTAPRSWAR